MRTLNMRKTILASAFAAVFALSTAPAFGHHSFAAEYDGSKAVTLRGKVTMFEWVNPHSWVHISVTDDKGNVTSWSCETAPPNLLYRQGWRRDSIKEGDEVVIEGFMSKDGSHTMNARSVQTPDGKKLFAGTASDGGPQGQDKK
jgi:hypothetical protein